MNISDFLKIYKILINWFQTIPSTINRRNQFLINNIFVDEIVRRLEF